MKNLFLFLIALALLLIFGGSSYFLWDVSKGARFERTDQSTNE